MLRMAAGKTRTWEIQSRCEGARDGADGECRINRQANARVGETIPIGLGDEGALFISLQAAITEEWESEVEKYWQAVGVLIRISEPDYSTARVSGPRVWVRGSYTPRISCVLPKRNKGCIVE